VPGFLSALGSVVLDMRSALWGMKQSCNANSSLAKQPKSNLQAPKGKKNPILKISCWKHCCYCCWYTMQLKPWHC